MTTVYVLECEDNYFYVGKTRRKVSERILEHLSENGSQWTILHKPVKLIQTKTNADNFDEDKFVKIYMKQHGIERVRGGSYSQVQLPEYQIKALETELRTASDLCFRCGRKGHYSNKCFAKTKADGTPIDLQDDQDKNGEDEEDYDSGQCIIL